MAIDNANIEHAYMNLDIPRDITGNKNIANFPFADIPMSIMKRLAAKDNTIKDWAIGQFS